MKVEILYVAECPSHAAAVTLVRDVLAAQGVDAEIAEVLVPDEATASELKFLGSPSIRINGRDVAESQEASTFAQPAFAMSCRLYPGSLRIGLPPVELVHRAVVEARDGVRS